MTLIFDQESINFKMVLGYLGYALKREGVAWLSGIKLAFPSNRSPQPRHQGSALKLEGVFRDSDVNINFRSLLLSSAKMPNLLTFNRRRYYRKSSRIAEYSQTRAPMQLPSQGIKRFSMKMRERLVCSLIMLVTFSPADTGKLLRRRF